MTHQPDCEGPDDHSATFKTSLFFSSLIKEMPGCCVKQLLQPWRWYEEGQGADCARLLTKHLSLLVLTPSLNTHKFLLLVALKHTLTISLGCSTRVGQSVGSEGTRNKTLLCICHAVPTALPSQPFSGSIRIGCGALP